MGRYALLGRVGRGGMGEVHRARAFGAAGVTKELCIKRIRCERLADPASLARFVAEARVSMRLSHANIVSVFDFGRSENDYYLAMEWVDGCDLRRLLGARQTPLDEDVALYIAAEIARGLAYIHELGDDARRLAHCDLKPANVLVSRAGEVKIADFGVAVHEATLGAGGTRRYMAPEQWTGGTVGPAVDLYALGLVLDEMLGGDAARQAPSDRDAKDAPPHAYAPPEGVAPALGALLTRLCALEPSARPASASEVLDALEALLAEARVRSKRSPRELLAREVGTLAVARAQDTSDEAADFKTDASYVTEGESETFARRMRPDASPRTESRNTPMPPRPPPTRWTARVVPLLALVALVAITFQLGRSRAPEPVVTERPAAPATSAVGAPAVPPAEVTPPRETSEPAPPRDPLTPAPTEPARRALARVPSPTTPEAPPPPTSAEPAPVAPAVVRLNARPWADVTIDGTARGVTPLVEVALAPGGHDIVFTNPALGASRTEHVDLVSGEHRDVIVDLR